MNFEPISLRQVSFESEETVLLISALSWNLSYFCFVSSSPNNAFWINCAVSSCFRSLLCRFVAIPSNNQHSYERFILLPNIKITAKCSCYISKEFQLRLDRDRYCIDVP